MQKSLKIVRLSDGQIFNVFKVLDNREYAGIDEEKKVIVHCLQWEGEHVIGRDCKWLEEQLNEKELFDKLYNYYKDAIFRWFQLNNVEKIDLFDESFYTSNGMKIYWIDHEGNIGLRLNGVALFNLIDSVVVLQRLHYDLVNIANLPEHNIKIFYKKEPLKGTNVYKKYEGSS